MGWRCTSPVRFFRTFVTGPGGGSRRRPLLEHGGRHDVRRGDGDGARAAVFGGVDARSQLDPARVRAHDAGGARGRGERPLAAHSWAGGKKAHAEVKLFNEMWGQNLFSNGHIWTVVFRCNTRRH